MPLLVVKRKGRKEKFDERKVYGSVYSACRAEGYDEKKCEKMSAAVTKALKAHIKGKKQVTSTEIFRVALKHLRKHDRGVAFLYETHRDIS